MIPVLNYFLRLTIFDPRAAAEALIGLKLPRTALWALLWLIIVLSVIAAWITVQFVPLPEVAEGETLIRPSPFGLGMIVAASAMFILLGGYYVGRAFGGQASFEAILVLVVWVQAVLLLLQIVQAFFLFIALPELAGAFDVLGPLIMLWLLANFLAVAHGFTSRLAVFLGMFGSAIVFGLVLGILLVLLGIDLIQLQ